MQGISHPLFYGVLMLVAGLGIPVMAALNGSLGVRLQNPAFASAILFLVGFVIAVSYLLLVAGVPSTYYSSGTPWYYYSGGVFMMFYALSITWVAPRFGVANAISFVLLGQLIAMSIIDHFALFGAQQYVLTLKRILGLSFMAMGVFMVLSKSSEV